MDVVGTLRQMKKKMMDSINQEPQPSDLGSGYAASTAEELKKRKKKQEDMIKEMDTK
jgi:hypothetical protein